MPTRSFSSDVLRLVSGTTVAQAISIGSSLVVARLFAPSDIGVASSFAALCTIIAVFGCWRFELAIVLPENDRRAKDVVILCFCCLAAATAAVAFGLVVFGDEMVRAVGMRGIGAGLWLIPFVTATQGSAAILRQWRVRKQGFGTLASAAVATSVITNGASVGLGFVGANTGMALIWARVLGHASELFVLARSVTSMKSCGLHSTSAAQLMATFKRYSHFPLFSSWGAMMNAISWQLPVLLLGSFYSDTVVGLYAFSLRMVQLPMSIIGASIGQVFTARAAKCPTGMMPQLVANLFRKLLAMTILPTIFIAFFGQELFEFVFGAVWRDSGRFSQFLAPWALVWFISSPLSTVYTVLEKQKLELGIHLAILTSRVGTLTIGGYLFDAGTTIALFAGGGVLVYSCLLFSVFRLAGVPIRSVANDVRWLITYAAVIASTLCIVKYVLVLSLFTCLTIFGAMSALFVVTQYTIVTGAVSGDVSSA